MLAQCIIGRRDVIALVALERPLDLAVNILEVPRQCRPHDGGVAADVTFVAAYGSSLLVVHLVKW